MKLYNLYQNVILEEIAKAKLLTENMSTNDVDTILDGDPNREGMFFKVKINYKSENGEVSERFIEVYQRNISTANNPMIDAYQLSKNNKESGVKMKLDKKTNKLIPVLDKIGKQVIEDYEGWRKFRLDRIISFKITKVPFYKPRPGFNDSGNMSKTVSSTQKIAGKTTDYQYKQSTLNQRKQTQQQAQLGKINFKNQNYGQLEKQRKEKLEKDSLDNLMKQLKQPMTQKPVDQQPIKQPNPEMDDELENKDELNK